MLKWTTAAKPHTHTHTHTHTHIYIYIYIYILKRFIVNKLTWWINEGPNVVELTNNAQYQW